MTALLGRLAEHGVVRRNGEVLSTQALAILLRDDALNRAFGELVSSRAGRPLGGPLTYLAEATQDDRARPDLEGLGELGPVVKVEAKFGASLTVAQLECYLRDQQSRLLDATWGVLVVLIPGSRLIEAERLIAAMGVSRRADGSRTWEVAGRRQCIVVLSWTELCDSLVAGVSDEDVRCDLRQFRALVDALAGAELDPFSACDLGEGWQARRTDFEAVVDRATVALVPFGRRVPPMDVERDSGYCRRYGYLGDEEKPPNFSVGVRAPLGGRTPVWMRYHRRTAGFAQCRARLLDSRYGSLTREDDGHIWVPIFPLLDVGAARVVEDIERTVRAIDGTARGVLPGGTTEPLRVDRLAPEESSRRYPAREILRVFEGGTLSTADSSGELVLIVNEGTLADLLGDEEEDFSSETVYVFASTEDRWAHAATRGRLA